MGRGGPGVERHADVRRSGHTSTLDRGDWLATCPGCITPDEVTSVAIGPDAVERDQIVPCQ